MARRKRAPKKLSKSQKGFWHNAGVAGIKGLGSAAMGASVGVVEEAVGDKASMGLMAGMALGGLASEIFVDGEAHPYVAELGRQALGTSTTIPGYQAGKAVARKTKAVKQERDFNKMKDRLQADMEAEARGKTADATPEEVKRARPKTKANLTNDAE